jgi:hypothetical protein
MCIGNTTSPASSPQQTINWGRGPWDERPAIQVGEPDMDATGPNVTSKNKSSLKATKSKPKAQSTKTSGGAY